MPRYGIVLEVDGALCGVMLMVSQRRGDKTFCNLSSWYVREANRGLAPFMFGHALKAKDVTYLDCSPTPQVVPIIENTAHECDLADRMAQAMNEYPDADAVLVRRHGLYVWGRDWQHAKTQAECYDYLFNAAVQMRKLGFDPTTFGDAK